MSWKNRVVSLEFIKAGSLIPDQRNYRLHPENQRQAMKEVLENVGWASAAIARYNESGELVLVDGHLRADLDKEEMIPVLIVDLDESEAAAVMATHDPLAGMAEIDTSALQALLEDMPSVGEIMTGNLDELLDSLQPKPVRETSSPSAERPRLEIAQSRMTKCPECGHDFEIPPKA